MISKPIHLKASTISVSAALSALLLILSFPKFGNGILAWVALVPLFHALRDAGPEEGFRIGFMTGLFAHVGILYWISYAVVKHGHLPIYMGISAMLLLAAYLSLYTAFFAAGLTFLRARGSALYLTAPPLWTILEFMKSHFLTGFPWENLAYSQYHFGNIIQIADITGTYGISFAIVLINAVLYDIVAARFKRARYPVTGIATAAAVLLAIYSYGHFRIADIQESMRETGSIEVALVQGNIDQSIKWDDRYQSETLDIYRSLSLESLPAMDGLLVWPETAAPFYFERPGTEREAVIQLTRISGRSLLFGSPRYEEGDGKVSLMNSAYLLRSDGVVAGRYDKTHLVPYGEYVPLKQYLPFMGKLVAGVGDFRPSSKFAPLSHNGHRLGVLICYEAIFPEAARSYKNQGAGLLINITNDAWFGRTSAPFQHLSMTVFRAIENRLYLVRAANTGVSAVIDPTGIIRSRTDIFERTVLRGRVKFIDERTFYAAYGDLFVYACALLLILTDFIQRRRMKNA
ncbi:MAG: apolipoprotein N-acyltransferase [Deltaproteobacteria bacterium]|nr:apolipoprotein N-acyltransferase [Deltaproteobacteria bacterium]